jgi:large conductance mechanosensitive channel
MRFVKEFKAFAMRGNVLDLAVGIIIGAAFGKIVSSFVNDIFMPPLGLLLGGMDFKEFKWILQNADALNGVAEVSLNYGAFFQVIIDFLLVSICVFLLIKAINRFHKKEEAKATTPVKEEKEEVLLLTEIRDLLKDRN